MRVIDSDLLVVGVIDSDLLIVGVIDTDLLNDGDALATTDCVSDDVGVLDSEFADCVGVLVIEGVLEIVGVTLELLDSDGVIDIDGVSVISTD